MKNCLQALCIILSSFSFYGCGVGRLDQGIMELGERQSHFVCAWGLPDRQFTRSGQDLISANWGGGGGSFFKGKGQYEIWVYESRKTELAFKDRKLAGYDTSLNRQELQNTFVGDKNCAF